MAPTIDDCAVRYSKRNTFVVISRNRTFYGKTLQSGLQQVGETVFMPNWIDHSVYNLDETIAVGDNYFYDSCFEELPICVRPERLDTIHAMIDNLDKRTARRPLEALRQMSKAKLELLDN